MRSLNDVLLGGVIPTPPAGRRSRLARVRRKAGIIRPPVGGISGQTDGNGHGLEHRPPKGISPDEVADLTDVGDGLPLGASGGGLLRCHNREVGARNHHPRLRDLSPQKIESISVHTLVPPSLGRVFHAHHPGAGSSRFGSSVSHCCSPRLVVIWPGGPPHLLMRAQSPRIRSEGNLDYLGCPPPARRNPAFPGSGAPNDGLHSPGLLHRLAFLRNPQMTA